MPRVFVICFSDNRPCGGIRHLYKTVDILAKNGVEAYIRHDSPGFRCTWFENKTPIDYGSRAIQPDDFVIIPEVLRYHSSPGRRVVYNQNCYYSFIEYETPSSMPYFDPAVKAVVVVSQDSHEYLSRLCPNQKLFRVHPMVGPLFYPQPGKKKQVCWMPRKNTGDIQQVIGILNARKAFRDFTLVPIANFSYEQVAGTLRESSIFLSFGYPEGLGSPPIEAMAAGCVVIGYHGQGCKEFFKPEFSYPIEVGNIVGFVDAVEKIVGEWDEKASEIALKQKQASEYVRGTYTSEQEEKDTMAVWEYLRNLA